MWGFRAMMRDVTVANGCCGSYAEAMERAHGYVTSWTQIDYVIVFSYPEVS